jgi:glycosyltransferase involved in cell wall biosynthesis
MSRKALFLTGEMNLGGGAMFVLNVCEGLREIDGGWEGMAGVFSNLGSVGQQTIDAGHEMLGPFPKAIIHEDAMAAMYSECQRLRPDAVIANLGGDAFDFLRFVPPGVLRIAIIHSDQEPVYRQILNYAKWIDVVVAVSQHTAATMTARLSGNNPVVAPISCGIPVSPLTRSPHRSGKLRVLYLGRIDEEQKRVSLMARIIRESVRRIPDIEWTIIGDGPQLPETRNALSDLAAVHFTGALPYSQARAALPEHDVFFLCSDYEGLPLSMLEAMSAGLVPVVSDLPSGISEVVHDGNGIRVPMDDEQGYTDALLRLASDTDLLEAMSGRAREDVIENYSIQAMAQRWSDLLDRHVKHPLAAWPPAPRFDLPPTARKTMFHHPLLRPLRRVAKNFTT